jgi:alkylated DNA repair dioxygenase AlkB
MFCFWGKFLQMIAGLSYIPDYLRADEQAGLLSIIDQQPWLTDLKRRVQHYGYRYDYKTRVLDTSMYLGGLPDWAMGLAEHLYLDGHIGRIPDQLIVNEYLPGQGISAHVDCVPCFDDTILCISLGSACVMVFRHLHTNKAMPVLLESGSLVVMRGEARYDWKHAIPARKKDVYEGREVIRGRRVSLTFRNIVL